MKKLLIDKSKVYLLSQLENKKDISLVDGLLEFDDTTIKVTLTEVHTCADGSELAILTECYCTDIKRVSITQAVLLIEGVIEHNTYVGNEVIKKGNDCIKSVHKKLRVKDVFRDTESLVDAFRNTTEENIKMEEE